MTHSRRVVFVLGLAAMISVGSPNQGEIFYGINSARSSYILCPVSVQRPVCMTKGVHCSSISRTTISRAADLLREPSRDCNMSSELFS